MVFYLFGMYKRFWRYATVDDVVALMIANSAASVAMAAFVSLAIFAFGFMVEFSRSVLVVDWILAACGVAAVRLSIRVIGESHIGRRAPGEGKRVLIAGAGAAGAMVVREMQRNPGLGMDPVGFLDDDRVKIGKRIYGVPVLGALSKLPETVKARRIDEVIIAMPRRRRRRPRHRREPVGDRSGLAHHARGVRASRRERQRQPAAPDRHHRPAAARPVVSRPRPASYVAGRTVLVTGGGRIDRLELCRQVAHGVPRPSSSSATARTAFSRRRSDLRERYPDAQV